MIHSDLIIIGSGPGGYRAAHYAALHGLSVVIIEKAEAGGTCLNRGCIPTKTLCRNAEIVDTLRHADTFGLIGEGYSLDFGRVMERKQEIVGQLRSGVETLMQTPGITLVRGTASFADAHTVAVGNEQYTAENIIIATGSDSKCPPIEGTTLPGVVTSTELLDIDHLPKRLCIIGAGVIGMEFASVFSSFGSNITVIEFLKECLPVLDSDIAKRLRQTIGKRGVEFYMQSAVKSITQTDTEDRTKQLTVSFEKKGKPVSIDADMVLIATGRKPCTEGLALEQAGIEHSPKGIVVDDDFQTNVSGVYAIGDVNGRCLLAHAATFQGLHVVNRILNRPDDIRFDVMPSAIFTNPEAASVGLSEDQLKAEQRPYECRKGFYRSNGKALAMNETDGMIKLLVDTTNDQRIVGCHAFGAHSADMVQEIAALMNSGTTLQQLANIIHIHPTLSEILHDMAL
ncbi:dihydrolipoyl dehydrogenase [uncultured Prevotella sp.]|uniref:dihydrolipoyl dehydrogenase n=1 Tax=uncultured Prevotella sp. TaxID=159272 RepID=UPI00261CB33D|nr:dihydrolipoyl dehydrogenase [uncultured Prevotella sp.]